MTGAWDSDDRERQIAAIQTTYDSYRQARRYRLWDPANPGIARQDRDRSAMLAALISESLPESRGNVLDLGCGEGKLAEALLPELPRVSWTGVDVRPEAVAEATRRVPAARFVSASADRVPLPDNSVDVVLAVVLFSSLPSRSFETAVAVEILRLLRPGGWLVWYDFRLDNPTNRAVHGIDRRRIHELFPVSPAQMRTTTLMPPVARRLGPLTAVMYPVLEAIPFLRSHLVGRLQRPPVA